jgi:hypothetical protein
MNLVGKIFTIIIFVLSLVFASFAVMLYATHKNWRLVADNAKPLPGQKLGLSQQLTQSKEENEKLRTERDTKVRAYETEKAAATQVRAKLESDLTETARERDDLKKKVTELDQQLRAAVAEVKTTHEALANLRGEVETLRKNIGDAQKDRDDHFKEVVRLTDEMNQAANELVRLRELNRTLSGDHAKALDVLRKFSLKPEPSLYADQPPTVDGVVTAVTGQGPEAVIEISLGSEDGLLKGHQLFVYRQAAGVVTLVSKIEIVRTEYDQSVGKVVPGWSKSNIVKGDRVATKIQ